MTIQRSKDRQSGSSANWKVLFAAVFAIYLSGGVGFGYVFVKQVESFFAIDLVGEAKVLISALPSNLSTLPSNLGRAAPPPPMPENGRVTVLLLGIDQREEQRRRGEPARTDTMMLATIEPSTRTAGLLSIPRDLWVSIPQAGPGGGQETADRINTAYFWGEARKSPGGGPALAKRTIEYNLGVKVHYYARIDFHGFERAVDTLGGVTVDVPKLIYDEEYPDDEGDVMTIVFRPGRQNMNGPRALQYVRTRHSDNDFGRAERQRQVVMAVRDQAMRLDALTKIPSLLGILGDAFQTDMPPAEMLRLGGIARSIEPGQIQARAIDLSLTTPTITSGGADVLLPNRKAIAKLVGEMFFDPNLQQENATIEVLNGTNKPGLASNVGDALMARGFGVTRVDTADRTDYRETIVRYYHDRPYSVRSLSDILHVSMDKISLSTAADRAADVTVILGLDARVP